jgi:hypothetical protein
MRAHPCSRAALGDVRHDCVVVGETMMRLGGCISSGRRPPHVTARRLASRLSNSTGIMRLDAESAIARRRRSCQVSQRRPLSAARAPSLKEMAYSFGASPFGFSD